mmetsp:Transcript_122582/g.183323  ORF Transcript_122582/g.183323 Transcript_122582/m.183323 type:complete len:264 (+) Transcript_122582:492-1283(+)
MTADGSQLCRVVMAAKDEVNSLPQRLRELAILLRELVRQWHDDVALFGVPEELNLLFRRVHHILVGYPVHVFEHGLPYIIGNAEKADLHGAFLVGREPWSPRHLLDEILGSLRKEFALFVHQVDVQPWELGFLQALLERVHTEVKLMVAQRSRVQLHRVQDVYHLLALEEIAEHRRGESIASEDHEGAIRVPFALVVDVMGSARHAATANRTFQNATHLVHIIEMDDRDLVGCSLVAELALIGVGLDLARAYAVGPIVFAPVL